LARYLAHPRQPPRSARTTMQGLIAAIPVIGLKVDRTLEQTATNKALRRACSPSSPGRTHRRADWAPG
jgi:hypothetical protein